MKIISLTLAGLATAMAPGAGSERDTYYTTAIVVEDDPSIIEENHDRTTEAVQFLTSKKLRDERRIRIVESPETAEAVISVYLSFKDYEKSLYAIDISIETPSETHKLDTIECWGAEPQLIDCIDQNLDKVTALLLEPVPEDELRRVATPTPEASFADDRSAKEQGRSLGRRGRWGIGTMATGAAAVVAGGVLFAIEPQSVRDDGFSIRNRSFLPAAIATVATGGVLLAVGTGLLLSDPQRKRKKTAILLPSFSPSSLGLSLQGHF